MKLADKKQIKIIHTLIAQAGMQGDKQFKEDLVRIYTEGRETSTTKLYAHEADDLIRGLSKEVPEIGERVIKNRKRRLVLHYAHEMRWELPDGSVDMAHVHDWCVKYGQYHKGLMAHNVSELSHLIVQMERVYRSFLKAV